MKKQTKQVLANKTIGDNLEEVLYQKAMGYSVKETTEEFAMVEDELKLTKKKVNVKYYAPDLNALELMLNKKYSQQDVTKLSDEELEQEKQKLIKQLNLM